LVSSESNNSGGKKDTKKIIVDLTKRPKHGILKKDHLEDPKNTSVNGLNLLGNRKIPDSPNHAVKKFGGIGIGVSQLTSETNTQ
jgi:hypothetical protein